MDISYCEELVTLAECLNFRKAAARLFITQSTLSKHVTTVEREVGFRIFERSTQKVSLTESGAVFVEGLKDVVNSYETVLREARDCQADQDTTVRVMGPLLNAQLASIVSLAASQVAERRAIKVSMAEVGVRDYEERLIEGDADVAVGFRYAETSPELCYEHLFNLPFGIACHASHPLAERHPLSFSDLAGARMMSYPMEERASYHAFVREAKERHHLHTAIEHLDPDALCFPSTTDSVIFGVHFPDYSRFGGDIVARPLDDITDVFDVCVVRRLSEDNETVLDLFDAIVDCAGNADISD